MATVTKRIQPHRRLGLSATPTIQIAQKSSASFVKGAPVYIDSTGYLAASPTDTLSSSHKAVQSVAPEVLGFAQEDAESGNTSKVGVVPALPGMMFKGQAIDTTASSSAGALGTIAQTHVGGVYGIAKLSADTHYAIDLGMASNRSPALVLELLDPVSTVGGVVGFVIRTGWRQIDQSV